MEEWLRERTEDPMVMSSSPGYWGHMLTWMISQMSNKNGGALFGSLFYLGT